MYWSTLSVPSVSDILQVFVISVNSMYNGASDEGLYQLYLLGWEGRARCGKGSRMQFTIKPKACRPLVLLHQRCISVFISFLSSHAHPCCRSSVRHLAHGSPLLPIEASLASKLEGATSIFHRRVQLAASSHPRRSLECSLKGTYQGYCKRILR